MYLQDFVEVRAPFDGVAGFVSSLGEDLGPWVHESLGRDGELSIGPRWRWPSKTVELCVRPPLLGIESIVVPFVWRATSGAALFPEMDAEIALHPLGDAATHAQFRGRYTPPMAAAGKLLDAAGLHRVAELTVREVLERFRTSLEQSVSRATREV